jgi:ADP-heptose:LPS heptosyltransferase
VLEGNPNIDRVMLYEPRKAFGWLSAIRRERYDLVLDFLGNPRTALLTRASGAALRAGPNRMARRWAYNRLFPHPAPAPYSAEEKMLSLSVLGFAPKAEPRPRVHLAPDRRERARATLAELGPGPWLGIVPGSRRDTRRWPAASYGRLARLASDRLGRRGLVLWGPGERPLAEETVRRSGGTAVLAPETPHLLDLAATLEACSAVVTNCNGPKHLAVAVRTPTLTLHFSSDPAAWNPPGDPRHPIVRVEELDCIGCGLNRCPYALECQTQLTPERAFEPLRELIGALV